MAGIGVLPAASATGAELAQCHDESVTVNYCEDRFWVDGETEATLTLVAETDFSGKLSATVGSASVSATFLNGQPQNGSTSVDVTLPPQEHYLAAYTGEDRCFGFPPMCMWTQPATGPFGAVVTGEPGPDVTPPDTYLNPVQPVDETDRTPSFYVGGDPNSDTAFTECNLDRRGWSRCPNPYTTPRLAYGWHLLKARATDSAGNVDRSPEREKFRVKRGN